MTVGSGDVTPTELGGLVARATREAEARRASGELSEARSDGQALRAAARTSPLVGRREELA
jgi:hypothetical protein